MNNYHVSLYFFPYLHKMLINVRNSIKERKSTNICTVQIVTLYICLYEISLSGNLYTIRLTKKRETNIQKRFGKLKNVKDINNL